MVWVYPLLQVVRPEARRLSGRARGDPCSLREL